MFEGLFLKPCLEVVYFTVTLQYNGASGMTSIKKYKESCGRNLSKSVREFVEYFVVLFWVTGLVVAWSIRALTWKMTASSSFGAGFFKKVFLRMGANLWIQSVRQGDGGLPE